MRTFGLAMVFLLAGALSAGVIMPVEIKSGGWELFAKERVPEYSGPDCFNADWKPLMRKDGDKLISWFLPKPSAKHGRAISIHVLIGADNGWYKDAKSARQWLSGQGEGQWAFLAVCAPDVTQLSDPNPGSYALWLAVEYEDGTRVPFYGAGFPAASTVKTEPWALALPKDYKLEGAAFRAGNIPAPLKAGQHNIVAREKAPEFSGRTFAWDKWLGGEKPEGQTLITWPKAPFQSDAGKAVKYFVFYADLNAPVFNDSPERVAAWLSGKGQGQWDWFIECAGDVTQVLDPNPGKARIFIAAEFESGKRCGYEGKDCPKFEAYTDAIKYRVEKSAVKLALGYKPEAPKDEKIDIRARVQVYLKEGRSWTIRREEITEIKKPDGKIEKSANAGATRTTILKVNENDVDYQSEELDGGANAIPGIEAEKVKLQLIVPKPKGAQAEMTPTEEEVTVKAGRFACLRTEMDTPNGRATTWMSKQYPGLLVKQTLVNVTEGPDKSVITKSSTQELWEFKE